MCYYKQQTRISRCRMNDTSKYAFGHHEFCLTVYCSFKLVDIANACMVDSVVSLVQISHTHLLCITRSLSHESESTCFNYHKQGCCVYFGAVALQDFFLMSPYFKVLATTEATC